MTKKCLQRGYILILLGLLVAACSGPNRAASTPVQVPGGAGGDQAIQETGETQGATDAPSQVETLMAGDLATQTAMASGEEDTDGGAPAEPTATPLPTASPPEDEPTPVPPTATAIPPTDEPSEPEPEPEPEEGCSSPYTVQSGDWVWDIGRRCDIHPDSIIAANGLIFPYILQPGDVLILPDDAPPFPGP